MLGAIAGDICGSPHEGGFHLPDHLVPKAADRYKFFGYGAVFTDDTVCTIAVADALLSDMDFAAALRRWVRRYPGRGYGGSFERWAESDRGPYNSFANGGAMRVSPCALLAKSLEEAEQLALASAAVTHNHPEGLRGAQAISAAIWLTRHGATFHDLRKDLQARYGYDLSKSVEVRARDRGMSALAIETVPDALVAAIEAKSWRHTVSNALWIGGDCDTVACMAGGIAEARFGVPRDIAEKAVDHLPDAMVDVLEQLYGRAELIPPWKQSPAPNPSHGFVARAKEWVSTVLSR